MYPKIITKDFTKYDTNSDSSEVRIKHTLADSNIN